MTRPDDIPADVWEKSEQPAIDLARVGMLNRSSEAVRGVVDHHRETIARIILFARAEQREEDARILLDYPPDDFFKVLWDRTTRDEEGDPFWKLQGDTGNWAAHMMVLLEPYAAAIRNGGKQAITLPSASDQQAL